MKPLLKKFATTSWVAIITLAVFFTASYAFAQEDASTAPQLFNPQTLTEESPEDVAPQSPAIPDVASLNQKVVLESLPEDASTWESDGLSTAGLKFMIRGKEALAWSLNIDQTGFDNPSIKNSYYKVLTIVNSILIIGLLLIAGMWMFSLVIPRQTLKKVVFYYVAAAIFVNFAFPLNRLFIDSTNLLQRSFLVQDGQQIAIADIVETPAYNDNETVGYLDRSSDEPVYRSQTLRVDSDSRIISGILQNDDGVSNLILSVPADKSIPLTIESKSRFSPNFEQSIFATVMMILTGIAYFILALIFVARIVILWALMILSPVLFIMAVFEFTRGYFYNWLGIYSKWLLIGPLAALGIAIVVGIWKTVGLPITSLYNQGSAFGVVSNIGFVLPGSSAVNKLSNASEMMEYFVFLLMLYLPILFAFSLTRHKTLANIASTVIVRTRESFGGLATGNRAVIAKDALAEETKNQTSETQKLKESKISKFTKNILPDRLKESSATPTSLESASTFLPEQLAVSSVGDIINATGGLIGVKEGSRHSHEQVIEMLAVPEQAKSPAEREKLMAVRTEIEKRANQGNAEAILIQNEIKNVAPQENLTQTS